MFSAFAFAANPAAEIVSLEGKGEYREPQQIDWRAAKLNQSVYPSNFVRTGDQSKMALLFSDRTQIRLAQNSVLQIKEISQGKDQKTILNLNSGRSWMQSKTTPNGLTIETPSALAAVRGTDWELVVDGEGRSTLTVFSGEIDFHNDFGRVLVGKNEQASAEVGHAPVKVNILNPRERIQWVSALSVDARRYHEPDAKGAAQLELDAIAELIESTRLDLAFDRLGKALQNPATDSASARLVMADFLIYNGELAKAQQALIDAGAKFPRVERIDVAQSRLALLRDDAMAARQHANNALQKNARSIDALIALGEVERFAGLPKEATAAYSKASDIMPEDPRPWLGLGMIEAERENFSAAKTLLEKTIALDKTSASAWGELATLESAAGNNQAAQQAFEQALKLQPDNVVMLTGKGLLELKLGHDEDALNTLLKASLIEPRYARAHLYQAVAYYRMQRPDRALQELDKVHELDAHDPLPHMLASMMKVDAIEPAAAIQEARDAVRLMPYLKSFNQVANNQAGTANVGNAVAFFGMESWARHLAQESYLPFWAGSHLFLADRYAGEFNQRAELMQGFLLDPIVFGASNRYQSLVSAPGHYATLLLRQNKSDDLKLTEPVVTLNGIWLTPTPVSYFLEAINTRITPGNTALGATAKTFTAALGFKPRWDMGFFIYANHLGADIDLGTQNVTGVFQRVSGFNNRVDAGGHYAVDASSQFWFKAGYGDERSSVDQRSSVIVPGLAFFKSSGFVTKPKSEDVQLRHIITLTDAREVSWGVEASRLTTSNTLAQDADFYAPSVTGLQNTLRSQDKDRSTTVYGTFQATVGQWSIDVQLGWNDYRKDRSFHTVTTGVNGTTQDFGEKFKRNKTNAAIGAVYRVAGIVSRAACQQWTKPASLGTLAPVTVAGIVTDDQLVFAGGELSRCRVQFEWEASPLTFMTLNIDQQRIKNLFSTLDGVLNTRADVSNLARLRSRVLPLPPKPDALEDTPVFSEAKVSSTGISVEHIVGNSISATLNYGFADSKNISRFYSGKRIPYLPRHQASVGATWAQTARSYWSLQAVYRSERFADEANLSKLPAGWDVQARGYIELDDKHWSIEPYALNLLKKNDSDVFGLVVSYRY